MTNETLYLMLNSNSKGYGLKQRAESFLLNTGKLIGELSPKFDYKLTGLDIHSDLTAGILVGDNLSRIATISLESNPFDLFNFIKTMGLLKVDCSGMDEEIINVLESLKNIQKGRQKLYTLKHNDVTYTFNNVRYLLKDKIVKCICNVGKDYTFVVQLFHSRHEEPIVLLCRRGDNGVISVIDSAKSINQLNSENVKSLKAFIRVGGIKFSHERG